MLICSARAPGLKPLATYRLTFFGAGITRNLVLQKELEAGMVNDDRDDACRHRSLAG
mgnify:CR=1 FL=1